MPLQPFLLRFIRTRAAHGVPRAASINLLEPRRLLSSGTLFDSRTPGDTWSPGGTAFGNQTVTISRLAREHADLFSVGMSEGTPG